MAREFVDRVIRGLKPGGIVVIEGFHRDVTKTNPVVRPNWTDAQAARVARCRVDGGHDEGSSMGGVCHRRVRNACQRSGLVRSDLDGRACRRPARLRNATTEQRRTTHASYTFTRELEWLGGLRGRAGYGVGRYLLYGTGGLARASVDHTFSTSNVVNTFVPSGNEGVWGYQAGGGVELRVGGRWSFGAEYLMTGLDDKDEYTVRVQGPAPATNAFILTNPAGTDLRRADQFDLYTLRFTTGFRF